MTEFEILSALANAGGSMPFVGLLNLTLSEAVPDTVGTSRLIRALLLDHLLSGSTSSTIKLEPAGQLRLDHLRQEENQRLQERRDRKAEEKRGFRRDLICALVGSAVTVLVDLLVKLVKMFV